MSYTKIDTKGFWSRNPANKSPLMIAIAVVFSIAIVAIFIWLQRSQAQYWREFQKLSIDDVTDFEIRFSKKTLAPKPDLAKELLDALKHQPRIIKDTTFQDECYSLTFVANDRKHYVDLYFSENGEMYAYFRGRKGPEYGLKKVPSEIAVQVQKLFEEVGNLHSR